ncbi:S-4TM family putative pore-forming effector [Streptomyces mirabilis]|uniref:S-4TM family putative pore-forming effector n=1 Tax=Streptomyces mirabilis TaxID=68239 RepID=UPI0036C79941
MSPTGRARPAPRSRARHRRDRARRRGVLITLIGHGRTAVSIVGFFWFVVSAFLLKGLAGNTARQGALLQEMFDIALFHLPWRATVAGDPSPNPMSGWGGAIWLHPGRLQLAPVRG